MITSQDEPVVASVETLEMNVRKFDADWKSSGFSIPQLEGKFPRSRVRTYHLLEGLVFKIVQFLWFCGSFRNRE